jgi:hypothetical protein
MNNDCKKHGFLVMLFTRFMNWISKPNFYILGQDEYGGAESFGYQLITRPEDLPEGLIDFGVNSLFENRYLLLLNMGLRTSGGYSIKIVDVERCGCTLNVHYTTKEPTGSEPVTSALTNPYCLAAIPKFKKICLVEEEHQLKIH